MTESSVPRMKGRNGARLFKNPPQPHMCIQDFIQVLCRDNSAVVARVVYYITCRNQWRGCYINVNSLDTGHYGSVLCKCTVLGQNCNASQTFTACATLRRYESATTSHKDRGHSVCCNGQPRSPTNERQECSRCKGKLNIFYL